MLNQLGSKFRTERLKQNLTLRQLAEKASVSVSFLSEIERDIGKPSLALMRRIAQALNISQMSLVSDNENLDPEFREFSPETRYPDPKEQYIKDVRIVRSDRRKRLSYPNTASFYELLTPDLNRRLQVLYGKTEPGMHSGEPLIDPPGEKFMFQMKGSVEYLIGDEKYILNAGDSIYYPADLPISWRVLGDEGSETILVITPPGF